MFLDEVDVFIIAELYSAYEKKQIISSWTLAKEYKWKEIPRFENNRKESIFYNKKNQIINKRLKRLCSLNILSSKKEINGTKVNNRFFLNLNKIERCNFNFTKGKREGIAVKNDKEIVFEI